MAQKKVLVVDDQVAIRDMLKLALENANYAVLEAANTREAHSIIIDQRPDIVLLDWMLPDTSGIELARRLKRDELTQTLPIIMLTAKGEEDNRIQGLEVGADDYIVKPFSPRELLARIKAVLRRSIGEEDQQAIKIEGLELDPSSHRVSIDGESINIGPTEFKLLNFFMTHPERVYSRSQLLDQVWGGNVYVEERTVDVHIRRLRKAISVNGYDGLIQTVRGAGYRFSNKLHT